MAQRHRVLIVLPSGSQKYTSLDEAKDLVRRKRIQWIEEEVSAISVTSRNQVDYSRQMGPHFEWLPTDSGGATVMQLV